MIDYVALGIACIIAVVWLVRLEGRINANEAAIESAREASNTRLLDMKELLNSKLEAIDRRLAWIEGALGGTLKGR